MIIFRCEGRQHVLSFIEYVSYSFDALTITTVRSIGYRLVGRIEEFRGGNATRPTQRSRVAAYAVLSCLFGLYTLDEFITWASHTNTLPRAERDLVSAEGLTLIAELVLAMEFGASAEDVALTCHAHPSLNEAVKEAALAVAGRALHI